MLLYTFERGRMERKFLPERSSVKLFWFTCRPLQVLREAGLPDGVFNVVHGLGNETGKFLVSHPKVSAVSFTGGTSTGEVVAGLAAPQFKKV